MKALPLIALLLCSCVHAPTVHRSADGGITATMGFVFAARRKNVVAEITTREGDRIRYQTEEESGEDVPKAIISGIATVKSIEAAAASTINAANNETARVLSADSVKKNKDTLDAAGKVTSEAIPLVEGGPVVAPIKPPGS